MVMAQGANNVVNRFNSIYTTMEALGPTFNQTTGDILGTGHALQTAQDAANPGVYELFGETIMAARTHLSDFANTGLQVTHVLDAFGAKVVADLQGPLGGTINQLLGVAVQDLIMFGQVLGNLGHALLNFAAAMPGLAEVLLKIIDGVSQLVLWVSKLNPVFLAVVFGIEEAYRWSGLAAAGFGLLGKAIELVGTLGIPVFVKIGSNVAKMGAAIVTGIGGAVINISALAEKLTSSAGLGGAAAKIDGVATSIVGKLGGVATFLSGPWGIALGLAAAAVGVLVIAMLHHHDATQQFIIDSQKAVAASQNIDVLNTIGVKLAATSTQLNQAQKNLGGTLQQVSTNTGDVSGKFANMNGAVQGAVDSVNQLTTYQQKLATQTIAVVQGAADISKQYGVTFPAALAIADAAGVKLVSSMTQQGKLNAQAQIQIDALVLGYKKMDQSGATLSNSMSAVAVQAGIQQSKVSQLNSAWDSFIAMGTSLTGTFTSFQLDLQQMGNLASTVGGKIHAFAGTTGQDISQIAQSLKSFSGTSAQTWQAYDQSIQAANSFNDALRVGAAAGVVTQKQYTTAVASVANQLLPYAANSKAALAELSMLVQEAGGPASSNFSTLKTWLDKNSVSGDGMNKMLNDMTVKLTNVGAVAKNFAGTLQSDVVGAIAQGALATSNITGLTNKYTTALQSNAPNSVAVKNAQNDLTTALTKLHVPATDINQIETILTGTYGQSTTATDNNASAADKLGQHYNSLVTNSGNPLINNINKQKQATYDFGNQIGVLLPGSIGTGGNAMDKNRQGPMQNLNNAIYNLGQQVNKMAGVFARQWPSSEHTNVKVSGSGSATIKASGGSGISPIGIGIFAGGGVIPGFSPGHDSVPALLSPGEGILTPHAVKMIGPESVHALNSAARHFAAGGVVNATATGQAPPLPHVFSWGDRVAVDATNDITKAFSDVLQSGVTNMAKSAEQKLQAQLAAMSTKGLPMGFSGATTKSAAVAQAFAASLLSQYGWSASQMASLIPLWNQESGWSAYAVNQSSGAYGIPQSLGHGHPYALGDYQNQIIWGLNYIKATYGSPAAAEAHERAFNWYDNGGWLMPGMTMAYNGTGRPEKVSPPGGGDGQDYMSHTVVNLDGEKIWENMQKRTLRYGFRNSGQPNGIWKPQ
jgi:hypothetical protein